ncbi:ABC transporter substrate-binding protein, partial [Methylobacterium radiotolerans]
MSETVRAAARVAPIRRTLPALIAAGLVAAGPVRAADPIKIGVIAEAQSVAGASIPQAVQLAADEINAQGGVDGRQIQVVTYDDKSSASDAV